MAVNQESVCESLYAAYEAWAAQLARVPLAGSVSEGGRSLSYDRGQILKEMASLRQEMEVNGCAVPGGPVLFVITSRARP
jgi:hypothetical protein